MEMETTAILGSLSFLVSITFGIGAYCLIIQYEKYGGDPKKRSLGNQLVSIYCTCSIIHCLVCGTIAEIFFVNGQVGHCLGWIFITTRMVLGVITQLIPAEHILFKCYRVFRGDQASGIDHDFCANFLLGFNIVMGLFVTVCFLIHGGIFDMPVYVALTGNPPSVTRSETIGRFWLILCSTIFNIVIVGFSAIQIKKRYEVWKDSKQSEAVLDQTKNVILRWNNVSFNPSIATIGLTILAIVPFLLLISARYFALKALDLDSDEFLGTVAQTWNEIILICISYIFNPWIFFVYKEDFQTFVRAYFKNIFFSVMSLNVKSEYK